MEKLLKNSETGEKISDFMEQQIDSKHQNFQNMQYNFK